MCGHIRNQQPKETKLVYLAFLLIYTKNWCRKLLKQSSSNLKVCYIIPLNYRFTGHPEISKSNYIVFKKDQVFNIT